MKLKEFSLWGFKLDLDESRKFTLFNRCVCAHFERCFEPINTDGIYRVVIKLSDSDDRIDTTELSSSVLKFYRIFNFELFNSFEELPKKRFLLDTLYEALLVLCDSFNWPKDNFKIAYETVIKDNFLNNYSVKNKGSRNKKYFAELSSEHNHNSFGCYLKVRNVFREDIFSKLLFSEEPDEFLFNERIGDIKWLSNQVLVYTKKDKTEIERFEIKEIH